MQKNKAIVGVRSAGMKFCSRAEACSPSSLIVLRYIVIKYTSCDTVVFDYIPFSKFYTHTTGMTHFLRT